MQIYYWCPFLTNIATIRSVINSGVAIKKFLKKNISVSILNSSGEWDFFKNNDHKIEVRNLQKISFHKFLPKEGFVQSRISFFIIFILNFFPLLKIAKNKPNFLIIHLLTLLPILLSPILSKNTKIILRISGLPKLNFLRKFIWKNFSRYIYLITTPTQSTYNFLIEHNIFDKNKLIILKDPVINIKEINLQKNEKIEEFFLKEKFYIAIGRLTNQKNFEFLIESFCKIINDLHIKKLLILGEGEDKIKLKNIIKKYNAENYVKLIGFKKNVFKYINNAEALISTSWYEDPGFSLIEASILKKKIITSLVESGPVDMYNFNNNMCYFFKKNNFTSFAKAIKNSERESLSQEKKKNLLKFSKGFTLFNHFNTFKMYLN